MVRADCFGCGWRFGPSASGMWFEREGLEAGSLAPAMYDALMATGLDEPASAQPISRVRPSHCRKISPRSKNVHRHASGGGNYGPFRAYPRRPRRPDRARRTAGRPSRPARKLDYPGQAGPGMGGAMDLVTGARKVIVAMNHTQKGEPKIVEELTLPPTADRRVTLIVSDMAVIEPTADGLVLRELAPGVTVEAVIAATRQSSRSIPNSFPCAYRLDPAREWCGNLSSSGYAPRARPSGKDCGISATSRHAVLATELCTHGLARTLATRSFVAEPTARNNASANVKSRATGAGGRAR